MRHSAEHARACMPAHTRAATQDTHHAGRQKALTFIAGNSFSSVSCLPHVILKSKSGFSMSDTCEVAD